MGNDDSAICQEIDHSAIVELKPANSLNNDQVIEMASFKEIRGVVTRLDHVYDYLRLPGFCIRTFFLMPWPPRPGPVNTCGPGAEEDQSFGCDGVF